MIKQRGFNLVEAMVTVAIVGILVGIGIPSYQNHVINTNRSAAAACLSEYAQFMERVYTSSMRYDQHNEQNTVLPNTQCSQDVTDSYNFNLEVTARTFIVSAVPTDSKMADSSCGTLKINQLGARSAGNRSDSATIKKCF